MQRKKVLLVFSAFLCLLPTVTVALFAQQPDPPTTKRVSTAKQTGTALAEDAQRASRKLQQRCREMLKPIAGLKHLPSLERSTEAIKIWSSFFSAQSDEDLFGADEVDLTDCAVELPSVAARRDALQAFLARTTEQDLRLKESAWETQEKLDQAKAEELALLNELKIKQSKLSDAQASFAEAANFAVTLYKQRQEYKEAYEGEVRAYDRLADLTDQVLALAKQAVYRSSGPSWEALVNPPKPQIIRIETPAVPRSLYCISSTTPPAAPGLETWTWTNCHW